MTQPTWSQSIIEEVCKDYKRTLPKTKWIKRNRYWSSGRYYPHNKTIIVCLGEHEPDRLPVFLHELAHHLACRRKFVGHNKKFWTIHRELLVKYDCLTEQYKLRMARYMKNSQLYL